MTGLRKRLTGFTIVELLVVIVVIGILAAITIVSYTGVSQKATASTLQSDLANGSRLLKMYYVDHGTYPASLDINNCPNGITPLDEKYCLKSSTGASLSYSSSTPSSRFILEATDTANTREYRVTESSPVVALVMSVPTVTLGSQTWTKYNLDVGTRIANSVNQSNNSIVQKWCYNNLDSNCTIYGGLYQWNEMMQYSTTESVQGICPAGFHLPSNSEYKFLEVYLGMSQAEADATGWRGTDQGTQLKSGGITGWDGLIGGNGTTSSFGSIGTLGYYWTSTQTDATSSRGRYLASASPQIAHSIDTKAVGSSVRCVMN